MKNRGFNPKTMKNRGFNPPIYGFLPLKMKVVGSHGKKIMDLVWIYSP